MRRPSCLEGPGPQAFSFQENIMKTSPPLTRRHGAGWSRTAVAWRSSKPYAYSSTPPAWVCQTVFGRFWETVGLENMVAHASKRKPPAWVGEHYCRVQMRYGSLTLFYDNPKGQLDYKCRMYRTGTYEPYQRFLQQQFKRVNIGAVPIYEGYIWFEEIEA